MLSFDITDKQIKIVRGADVRGKIKITSALTVPVSEGLIVNGHIKDIPQMATVINNAMKDNKLMGEKEAVISLSSNLMVFKEVPIPKVKPSQIRQMVVTQMQQQMGVTNEYSIAYTIAGDDEGGKGGTKVLATACPRDMIEGYKKVFAMLGLSLKCVASSSNGISKIVQTDNKLADKCPMLLVQIDPHFLSLDLYENGQLSFTRFVAISENDYDDKNDYVFEAVNENIFRMFQFQKSRSNRSIRNVVFYGDTSQYIRLTNALEQMDISTQILKVPSQVYGYENFEFANYANAIGMMFKRNKDTEAINLMGTDLASVARSEVSGSSAGAKAIIAFLVCALAVGSVYAYFSISNSAKLEDIKAIDQYISSESVQSKLKDVELKESQLSKLEVLKQRIEGVTKAYKSYPILKTSTLDRITERLPDNGSVAAIAYKDGIVAMECSSATMQDPSTFVEKLYQLSNLFVAYDYTGYKVEQNTSINLVTGNPVIQLGEESNDYVVGVMLRGEEEIVEEEPVPAAN